MSQTTRIAVAPSNRQGVSKRAAHVECLVGSVAKQRLLLTLTGGNAVPEVQCGPSAGPTGWAIREGSRDFRAGSRRAGVHDFGTLRIQFGPGPRVKAKTARCLGPKPHAQRSVVRGCHAKSGFTQVNHFLRWDGDLTSRATVGLMGCG